MTTSTARQAPVIVPVRQRTPEWVEARKDGIGASEAAAALGISPYESRLSLWARKLGLIPPPEENLPMRTGTFLEPLIAELYTEATGVKIRRANQLRKHPVHDFMLASLDRRAGRKPVELKYSARGTGYGEPGTDEVPDEVLAQVLHQLAVTDEPEGDVAALIPGRAEVQIYTIRREAAAEAAIVEEEAVLWDHVRSRREPPLDGSEATRRALAQIYDRDDGTTIVADEATSELLGRLRIAQANLDRWQLVKDEAQAAIKAYMGEHYRLEAPGVGEVTWKRFERSTTSWKTLAQVYARTLDNLAREARTAIPELTLDGIDVSTDAGLEQIHAALLALYSETKPADRFGPPTFTEEE